jgi:hypothetical protein
LNSAGPGVELGGTRTLGGRGVGGATVVAVIAAAIAAATAIAIVVVILLLVRLLWLLRALLMLLLLWRAFLPTGGGRGRWGILRGVQGSGVEATYDRVAR